MIAPLREVILACVAAAPQTTPLAKEWNQPHGNAASTAFVDVLPLKSPPTERWRIKPEQLLAGPVVSQAKLFVVLRTEGKTQLVVLDPASGASVAKATLEGGGDVFSIAVGDGIAAVFAPDSVQQWRLAGSDLRLEKTIVGSFTGEPTLSGTTLLAPRGKDGAIQWIDWTNGKTTLLVPKAFGRASCLMDDKVGDKPARSLVTVATDDKQSKVTLNRFPVLATGAAIKVGAAEVVYTGPYNVSKSGAPLTVLVSVPGKEGNEWCAWFGKEISTGMLRKSGFKLLEFKSSPASASGRLYGFDSHERLIEFDDSGGNVNPLVEKADLRKGAQIGAPSIARDVLFLGNWAVELGSKHVLWCLESIEADGPAIPAGDELLVIRTKEGHLVGFGNGPAATSGTPAAVGSKPALAARAIAPTILPGTKPGIIRSDGVFIAGKASAVANGRWRIEPEAGVATELDGDAVALVDSGKDAQRVGEEYAIYRACWNVLAPRHAESLVGAFEKWREIKLYDECRRIVDEAKKDGLASTRVDELVGSIAGLTPAKLAANHALRKKCVEFESAVREKSADDLVAAAKWCAAHDAKTAATVLVLRASEISPQKPPDPELAKSWTPADFPEADPADASAKPWPVWADALLPSGATFAVLDDTARHRLMVTKFAQNALWLRTKNILLLSKETDPAIVGPLLARGEATVRALQKLLPASPIGLESSTPLDVRLHETRSDYLADRIVGHTPQVWSAGCFSPSDGVSRFYSKQEGDEGDPLSHTLHEVFAHELTHHYVALRWIRDRETAASGGYWMVEGFAEFVAGQALEIGRLGEAFDDATVMSLDEAAAASREDQLLALDYLLSLDPKSFNKDLEGGIFGPVQLHHHLKKISLDKRGVFYAEATALTFFVMNRCGEKGRSTYVDWLTKVYSGQPLVEPWKDLGFADLAAFTKAFKEFLASI